jgi:hypothetical protein
MDDTVVSIEIKATLLPEQRTGVRHILQGVRFNGLCSNRSRRFRISGGSRGSLLL